METKKYTQFGTFSVVVMSPLLLFFTVLMIESGAKHGPELYINCFLVLTFLICLLIFHKLTITINETNLSFSLGIGLIRKTYKISSIKSCIPVTNSPLYGIGIRLLTNGWLYNVSGLKAIELHFRDRKSIVRIGTDRPEEISSLVQSLI